MLNAMFPWKLYDIQISLRDFEQKILHAELFHLSYYISENKFKKLEIYALKTCLKMMMMMILD